VDVGLEILGIREPRGIPARQARVVEGVIGRGGLDAHTGVGREILQNGEDLGLANVQMLAQEVPVAEGVEILFFGFGRDLWHLVLTGDQ